MTGVKKLESRNAKIDAWRGISILLVIAGHLMRFRYEFLVHITPFRDIRVANGSDVLRSIILRLIAPLPNLGVGIFFVISGYLITTILLKEEAKYRAISIPAFCTRRIFRILPAFVAFLSVIAILNAVGIVTLPWRSLAGAGLFLCDTAFECGNWWVGHTWSLAVEEQFYLVWPLAFSLMVPEIRAKRLVIVYLALIAMSYFTIFTCVWESDNELSWAFPCISAGAYFACSPTAMHFVDRFSTNRNLIVALVLLILAGFFASANGVLRPFIPLAIAFLFLGTVRCDTFLSGVLSLRWLSKLGLVSYSLYLWQQFFTGSLEQGGGAIAQYTALCLPIAACSYLLIETPMIRIGHRLSDYLIGQRVAPRNAVRSAATVGVSVRDVSGPKRP